MQGREKVQSQLFGSTPLAEVLAADHPLRKIRADFDVAFGRLADAFETNYGTTGNPSVPTAILLRAFLLKALYSIKSERALCEQIEMNVGFRWFIGLDWDDKVFDHSTLSTNRERLFGSGAAEALLGEVVRLAASRRLLISDRLVVDGTLIKAWASHKSFKSKDGGEDDKAELQGNEALEQDAREHQRSGCPAPSQGSWQGVDAVSPGPRLGGFGQRSGEGLPHHQSVRAGRRGRGCDGDGDCRRAYAPRGQTLVADRGYDTRAFVDGLRARGIRAHPRAKKMGSSLDGRTTKAKSYEDGLRRRYIVEPVFGWVKGPGRLRQTKLRGTEKVGWEFHLYCIAYNLRRLAKAATA